MVKLAIDKLEMGNVVTLTPVDRTRLASNLMTVLVADSEASPVLSVDN
jgi:hypothetical protein